MSRLIPELNLKINFKATAMSMATAVGLGCHANTMAGVNMGLDPTVPFEWIDVLKSEGKSPIKIAAFGDKILDPAIAKKLAKILEENPICAEDHPDFAKDVIGRQGNIPLWFLSDVINRGAPARVDVSESHGFGIALPNIRTVRFAEYLIRNKIGYVLETPYIQNPLHRSTHDYSINQGWIWIPPEHAKRAIGRAAEHIGVEFPSEEEWVDRVGKDLLVDSVEALKTVFKDGRFPEPRFLNNPAKIRAA